MSQKNRLPNLVNPFTKVLPILVLSLLSPLVTTAFALEMNDQTSQPGAEQKRALYVLDPQVRGWQSLMRLLKQDQKEVLLLNSEESGVGQVTRYLETASHQVRSLVFLTEGKPGVWLLGNESIHRDTIHDYLVPMRGWKQQMTAEGELLLFGCRIAEGEAGVQWLSQLAAETGLNVAASSDFTGPARLGGDTDLEWSTAAVQADLRMVKQAINSLPAVMGYGDAPVVNSPAAQNGNEDVPFDFSGLLTISETGGASDRMEIVVRSTGLQGQLSDGEISDTELAAQGSLVDLLNFLNDLSFVPSANWNGAGNVEVVVTSDFNNRTAGNTVTRNFGLTIQPVNDAPVATGAATLAAVNEDSTNPAGATVSALYAGNFDDSADNVAGGSSAHTFAGVAVVGNSVNAAQGQWQFFNGTAWANVGSRSASTTLLLPTSDSLRFLPAANWFGTPSGLTVRLIDSSAGAVTRGTGPDLTSAFGGTTRISAATVTLTTSVTPVNDAPTTANFNITATKNVVATFSLNSADVDSGTNSTTDATVTSYRILTLPANGQLRTSANVLINAINTDLTVAQATNMTFTPANNFVGSSSFTFRASDAAGANSNTSTASIEVQPFNEPPVVTVPGPVVIAEDSSLNVLGNVVVADPDAGAAVIQATVTASHGTVTLSQLTGLTNAVTGGSAIANPTFSNLTFFGTMANLNAAMTGLRFTPAANYFGAASVTVTVNDLANTGNPAKEDSKVISVTVTNVPDAPVTGPAALAAVNEDSLAPNGASVSALLSSFSDADGDALAGVAISGNTADALTQGRWQYSVNNGMSWSNVGSVSPAAALLVNSSARVRFLPAPNYYGTPNALTWHAVDNSSARVFTTHPATRQTLNVTTPASDFDAAGNTLTTSITSVNDLFTVDNDYPLLVDEGGTTVLTSARLNIIDVEASPAQIVYTVLASGTNLNEGSFQIDATGTGNWLPLAVGGTFTQAQINLGRVRYTHNGAEPATAQTVAYSVTDLVAGAGGTTANRVLNILVSPVNDAPELYVPGQTPPGDSEPLNGFAPFDSTLTFSASNLRVVDPDNLDVQLIIRIESLPTNGVLQINTAPVAVGSVLSYADLAMLTYRHNGTATVTDSFGISIRDGAGGIVGAAGGTPESPVAINLTIVPYNHPPTIERRVVNLLEWDQNVPFDLLIDDEETDLADLTVRVVTLPPASEGELRFNGAAITQAMLDAPGGFTFAADDLSLLRFNHTSANRLNPPNFSFNISVTDVDVLPATTSATIEMIVRAVDDEPTLSVSDIALPAAGGTHVFDADELDAQDVDTADALLLYRVTTRPTNGTLLLNGVPVGIGGTFTQADVTAGRVTYVHRGWASTSDSFTVTLRDQGYNIRYNRPGGVYPDTVSDTLLAHTINITIPPGGTTPGGGGTSGNIGEGGLFPALARTDFLETNKNITLITPSADLFANDGGITPFSLVSVQMKAGSEADGTVSYNAGTGEVTFIPTTNYSGVTYYQYVMEDALNRQVTGEVVVTVYYVNYPPVIASNNTLTLDEGAVATITSALLEADDIDDSAESLVYTLLAVPNNGDLFYDSTPADGLSNAVALLSGDVFTQADLNEGRIKFQHDGFERFISNFQFRVTDGANPSVPAAPAVATFVIDATPINDRPRIEVADFIALEGGEFVLTPDQLSSLDVDGVGSDKTGVGFASINSLTYSMATLGDMPVRGALQYLDGATWRLLGVGDTFTAAQVTAGEVRYLHDGSESIADTIRITVNDNSGEANATASATLQVGIVPVNDDPILVKNLPLSLDEGATGTITFANHLESEDPDNTDVQLQYRLTTAPQFGTLWLDGVEALGVGSRFTQQDVLAGRVTYQHSGAEVTADAFDFTLSDGGGGNEPAETFELIINPVNDQPVIGLFASSIFAVEGVETDVLGIQVFDDDSIHPVTLSIDQDFGPLLVTLTVTGGDLDLRTDLATVVGDGSTSVTIEGTLGQINATLASLSYTAGPVAAVTGADTLLISVNDQGNRGAGGPLIGTEEISITLLGVNTAPVVAYPAAQSVDEEAELEFSSTAGNALSFSDPDIGSGDASANLTVTHGTLTLGSVAGLTSVSGNGSGSVNLVGTMAAINAALDGLIYQGNANYHGADTLTFGVNDQGNTGTFGGPLSDFGTVAITVNPINDAPTVMAASINMAEDAVQTLNLVSNDVDTGTDPQADAVVTHYFVQVLADAPGVTAGLVGELRTSDNVLLTASNSVTPAGFAALPAGSHVITVAQATGMTYAPPQHFNSALTFAGDDWRSRLRFRAIDILAANFNDSSKSAQAEFNIVVTPVNDAPVLAGGGDSVSYTEGSGLDSLGGAVVLNAAGNLALTDVELTVQQSAPMGGATVTLRRSSGAVVTDRFSVAENDGISLSGANVLVGGTTRAVITNNSSSGTLVLTFTNDAQPSHVQTILRNVAFASVANDLHGLITVSMVFNDGNTDAQGSGGALNSNAIAFTVDVTNVNDSPRFTGPGQITVAEDTAAPAGVAIQTIMAAQFTDPDPVALAAGQFAGIAILADASNQATQGRWQYSVNGTDWHDVNPLATPAESPSGSQALLLNRDSLLRFIPVANYNHRFQQANVAPGPLLVIPVDASGARTWTTNGLKQFADTMTGWTDTSDLGVEGPTSIEVHVTQVNDGPTIANLNDDSTFTEAVGVNVAGPAVLLDAPATGAASLGDIDLTVREETSFNGARLVVRARTLDPFDFFLPQVTAGISLSGAFTSPGPGVVLFNNGSLVRYNGVTVGTLTDNSSVSGEMTITFNANGSKEAVDALLQNLTYSNNDPTLSLTIKPIDITFHDGNGSAGNAQGAGGELSTTATVNMSLLPRNDSPVLSQGNRLLTTEDVMTTATSFDSLLGAFFGDPDELAIPADNYMDGVAIAGFDNAGLGEWQVSLNGTVWVNVSSINSAVVGGIHPERALLLGAATQVRFVPSANANTQGPVVKPFLSVNPVEASIPVGAVNNGPGLAAGPITFTSNLAAPLTYDTTEHPLESRVGGSSVLVDVQINAVNDAPVFASASAWTGTLIESPVNNVGTEPAQALLTGVSVTDVDPATSATLTAGTFGAGTITVALVDGVTGDRFFVNGTPAGLASQTGGTNGTNLVLNLATTATFAQVNAILEALRYEHLTDAPPTTTRAYTVTLNDGNNLTVGGANAGGPTALDVQISGEITIVEVNDPPLLTSSALSPTFVEDAVAAVPFYNSANVNPTGVGQELIELQFTVSNLGNGADERMVIDGTEIQLTDGFALVTGANGIDVMVSVTGSTATVTLAHGGLTAGQFNTLLNGLAYRNTSQAFVGTTRVITLTSLQDDGGTDNGGLDINTSLGVAPATITLAPRNDAPVLAATRNDPTAVENAGAGTGTNAVLLFSAASVSDVDFAEASFGGGLVRVTFAQYSPGDVIEIANDTALAVNAVRVNASNVQISTDGVAWTTIGTVNATHNGQAAEFRINLNATATESMLGPVINAVRYRSTSDNPTVNETQPTRSYNLVVNDGNNNALAGGPTALNSNTITGGILTITSEVDHPVIDLNGPLPGVDLAVTWNELANTSHLPLTIATTAEITDPDNAQMTQLTLSFDVVRDGNDERLMIGGVSFPLNTAAVSTDVGDFLVSYDTALRTFTIVPDGSDIATNAAFHNLVRGIQYNNLTDHPTPGNRVITMVVTDAGPANDGAGDLVTGSATLTLTVNPTNDQPIIADLTAATFFENAINAAAAIIDGDISLTDIDSPTYADGSITVSGLVSGQDVVSLPTVENAVAEAIWLDGTNVRYHDGLGWTTVGSAAGGVGANFVVSLNASANREIAERILENLTFANTSDNPTLVRTLTYAVNDGGANPVQPATIELTIRLENDAPELAATTLGATYTEQAAGVAFIQGGVVTDVDQPTHFQTGTLTVALDDYASGDRLSIHNGGTGAGQIRPEGGNVQFGGVTFATFSGGDGSDLVITFTTTSASPAAVSALLNALRFDNPSNNDPTADDTDTERVFTVTFDDGANTKHVSSSSTSLTDTLTGTITVQAVNDAPVLAVNPAAASYTEAAAPTVVDNSFTLSDVDDVEITGGSVTISSQFVAGDLLALTDLGNITSSYNAATGVLTLTGTDTLSNYQALLRGLTFAQSTTDPTVNGSRTTRTLTYSLTDANSDQVGAATGTTTKNIHIIAVNNPPVVVAGATVGYTEQAPATVIDSGIDISDQDDTHLASATVSISSGLTLGDVLGFTAMHGITGSYDAGTGVLTLTGTATLAQYEEALQAVTFLSTSDHPTMSASSRTISWVVTDANSDGVGAASSVPVTSTINLTPVNDPPEHAFPLAIEALEGVSFPLTGIHELGVSDVDSVTVTTRLTVTAGTLTVDLSGGASISSGANGSATLTLSGTLAQVNAALATVVYLGNPDFNGPDTLTLYTEDDGNPAPMLSATDVVMIDVISVNSPPVGTDKAVVLARDAFHLFTVADFGFTDPNDTPANAFTRVRITTLPALGSLTLNGNPVAADYFVTVADLSSGLLRYTPPAGEGGTAYASFTFQVEDDGGTANGGTNLDPTPRTMTLDVLLAQEICFCPPTLAYSGHTVTLDATATSGLPVTYSIVSGPGSVAGNVLSFTGAGTVEVMASQVGDAEYAAAPDVTRSVQVLDYEIKEGIAESWRVVDGGPEDVLVRRDGTARALAMELSGNTAVRIAATGSTTNPEGNADIYTVKYDAQTGQQIWAVMHAGEAGLEDQGVSVAIDSEGNVIIVGTVTVSAGNTDIYVAKYAAADGELLWEATYAGDGTTDYGNDGIGLFDIVNLVQKGRANLKIGPNDEVVIGGYVTLAGGNQDLVVIKYDAEGGRQWVTTYDSPSGKADYSNAIAVNEDGDVFVTGASAQANLDAITLKVDGDTGEQVWTQRYDAGKPDEGMMIAIDSMGNPVITGYSQHDTFNFMLIRYNASTGTELASRILDGPTNSSDAAWDMVLVDGGQPIITGTSYSANGAFDGYTLRFGCACTSSVIPVKWGTRFSAPGARQDQMVSIGADMYGNPVVTGYGQNVDGSMDVYTAKYRAGDGSLIWQTMMDGPGGRNDFSRAVAVDPAGNVFVAGYAASAEGSRDFWVSHYMPTEEAVGPAQTITFTQPTQQEFGTTMVLRASASSGLPVSYEMVDGPATEANGVLTFTGTGLVTVRAVQPGNSEFDPAMSVERSFNVVKGRQIIAFTLPAEAKATDVILLNPLSNSGLPITFNVDSGPGEIHSGQLTFTGEGVVQVSAAQAGNDNYLAATTKVCTILVGKAAQSIVFTLPTSALRTDSVTLTATATSGLPVTYTLMSGPGSIVGGTLSFTAPGIVRVMASQAGDARYAVAENVERTITIRNITPVLNPIVLDDAMVGETLSFAITGTMQPTRYTAIGLPPGVTFNATTGVVSGKPTTARMVSGQLQPYMVTFTAFNSAGAGSPVIVPWMIRPLPTQVLGVFNGLVERSYDLSFDSNQTLKGLGGRITVTIASTGSFTGSLQLETKVHSFSGRLNSSVGSNPSAAVTINRGAGLPALSLAFSINKVTGELTGTLSDAFISTPVALRAWRNGWHATTHPASAYAGAYNAGLEVPEELHGDASFPQGNGFGRLTVTNAGAATWAGRMADGTVVTIATTLGPDGQVPLFLRLYTTVNTTAGSVHGWSQITTSEGARLLDGELAWQKQAQVPSTNARLYPQGFPSHTLTVVGGAYTAPTAGNIVLGLPNRPQNAKLRFAEGGLELAALTQPTGGVLSQVLRINLNNSVTMPTGAINNPGGVALSQTPSTGAISGRFTLRDTDPTDLTPPFAMLTRTVTYAGLVVPRMQCAVGYYVLAQLPAMGPPQTTLNTSPQLSGQVILEANP
jgi:hypothetical protein